MKRIFMALAVMGLAATGSARADWGASGAPTPQPGGYPIQPIRNEINAPNTLMGLGAGQPGRAPDRYGMLPGLRKAFRIGGSGCDSCNSSGGFKGGHGGCAGGNCGGGSGHGGGGGPGYGAYPQYPPVNQGTLVFPNHQYVRSPRDFFMYEPGT